MPVLTLQPDAAVGYDTFIESQYSTHGTSTNLMLGKEGTEGELNRILIKFTQITQVPSTAVINSVTMQLYMWQEGNNYNPFYWSIWRVLKDWVETEATNEYYRAPGQPWGSTGADLFGTDISSTGLGTGSLPQNPTYGWWDFAINVAEFTKFINGTYLNYGWGLYEQGTGGNNSVFWFYSSDYATASLRPKLVIDYTIPGGGNQTIWWFKKWWKEKQELLSKPKILLPKGVVI